MRAVRCARRCWCVGVVALSRRVAAPWRRFLRAAVCLFARVPLGSQLQSFRVSLVSGSRSGSAVRAFALLPWTRDAAGLGARWGRGGAERVAARARARLPVRPPLAPLLAHVHLLVRLCLSRYAHSGPDSEGRFTGRRVRASHPTLRAGPVLPPQPHTSPYTPNPPPSTRPGRCG